MSINNNKSKKIIAYFADSNLVYREFISIAEAAEHFFNDLRIRRRRRRNRRSPIKYMLSPRRKEKKTLFLGKYHLSYLNPN